MKDTLEQLYLFFVRKLSTLGDQECILNWEIFTTNNIRDFRKLTSLAISLSRIFLHMFQSIGIDNMW